jgi:hypothetical protein
MSDPFAARRRTVFQSDRMPAWTAGAACRDKGTVEGEAWEAAFTDDLTFKATGEYRWPASLLDVMAVCAGCPVRRPCLEYGFAVEEPVTLGVRLTDDEEYELLGKSYIELILTPQPVGVYGGVPGPMRERFRDEPDRVDRAEAWFAAFTEERRWARAPAEEVA